MITVMIADDEPMLRMALKSIVPWESLGCRVIGEAANGKEACAFFEHTVPDILITDIKMPEMNGIELIRHIREKEYGTQILVLSGFDDFEFVREALVLGAVDYILKPSISEEKLKEVLGKAAKRVVMKKIEQENKNADKKTEQELLEKYLLYKEQEAAAQISKIDILNEQYYFICLRLFYNSVLKQNERNKEETLSNAVRGIIDYYCGKDVLACQTDFREWVLLMPQKIFREKELKEMLYNIQLYTGIRSAAGVSGVGENASEIEEKLKESKEAVDYSFYEEKELYYYSRTYLSPLTEEFWRTEIPQEILYLIQTENWSQIKQYELSVLKQCQEHYYPKKLKAFVLEYLIFVQSHLAGKIKEGERWFSTEEVEMHLEKIDTWEELHDFVYQVVFNLCDYIAEQLQHQYSPPVLSAVHYMEKHYMENISLGDMAEEIGINTTYLSRLFVKEMEITCVEYLASIRIRHAKELLKDKNMSVEEIAGKVGYVNSKYFFRVFKKAEGISPLKYRQRLLNLK